MTALYIVLGVFGGVILIAVLLRLAEHHHDKKKNDNTRYEIKTPRYDEKDARPIAPKETFDETHAHDAKGQKGERKMNKLLEEYCASHPGSYLISGVIIPDSRGLTSDIDHILFAPVGIFVIETKNYSGRIYGSDETRDWTQVLNYGKIKNRFFHACSLWGKKLQWI